MKPRTFSTAFLRSAGFLNNPTLADRRPARLELRLDQSHQPSPGRGEFESRRQRQGQADEADIGDDGRHLLADHRPVERPGVGAFQDHHPRVHPELGMELAAADVDRIDLGRAARDQDIAEAAGRGAEIERDRIFWVKAEGIQRRREFLPAARDVAARAGAQPELGLGRHLRARLERGDAGHADQPPPHEVGGAGAGWRQPALN